MRKVIKLLVNFLLEKGTLQFSKIENSFFLYKKLDKKIKIDKDIINLNYNTESPYSNKTTTVFITNKNNLYLWFLKENFANYIPEAYVIYRKLLLEYQNIIFVVRGTIDKVIVIKKSILVSSFSKKSLSNNDIKLLKDEFDINDIVEVTEDKYQSYLKNSFEYLQIGDLLNILNIKFDIKDSFIKGVQFLALPVFISSIVITLAVFGYSILIEQEKEGLLKKYKESQHLNYKLKEDIDKSEQKNILYKSLSDEFKYVDKSIALSEILKNTDDMNMSLYYIKIYENHVDFIVKTKNNSIIPIYIKNLFKSNLFSDIKNLNSRKLRDSIVEVKMSAKLKEI